MSMCLQRNLDYQHYSYEIMTDPFDDIVSFLFIYQWCCDTFGYQNQGRNWEADADAEVFYFTTHEDALTCYLRWA